MSWLRVSTAKTAPEDSHYTASNGVAAIDGDFPSEFASAHYNVGRLELNSSQNVQLSFSKNLRDGDMEDDDFFWLCKCAGNTAIMENNQCQICHGLKQIYLRKSLTQISAKKEEEVTLVTCVHLFHFDDPSREPLLIAAYDSRKDEKKCVKIMYLYSGEVVDTTALNNVGKVISICSFNHNSRSFILFGTDALEKSKALLCEVINDKLHILHTVGKDEKNIDTNMIFFTMGISAMTVLKISPLNPYDCGMPWSESLARKWVLSATSKNGPVTSDTVWIVMASMDKSFAIYTLNHTDDKLQQIHHLGNDIPGAHTDLLLSVAAYQLGFDIYVVTGSWDKTVRFWKLTWTPTAAAAAGGESSKSGKGGDWVFNRTEGCDQIIRRHKKSVTCVLFHTFKTYHSAMSSASQDSYFTSKVLITGSLDKTVVIWDLETREEIRKLVGHEDKINALCVHDTHMKGLPPMIITASEDKTMIIWNMLTGEAIRKLTCRDRVTTLAVHSSTTKGFVLTAGTADASLLIYNFQRFEHIRRMVTDAVTAIDCYFPPPTAATATASSTVPQQQEDPLVVIGTIDSTCSVFNYRTNKLVGKLGGHDGHTKRINAALVYSPIVNSSNADSTDYRTMPLAITCAADGMLKVWQLTDATPDGCYPLLKNWKGHTDTVFALAMFNPDLQRNYTASTATASAADDADGALLDLNKAWIFSGGRDHKFIYIWDLFASSSSSSSSSVSSSNAWHSRIETGHHFWIRSISVHHTIDGSEPLLIVSSYDQTASIWTMRTREKLHTLSGEHSGYIFATAIYDPMVHLQCTQRSELPARNNKTLLTTGSYDCTTVIWDITNAANRTCTPKKVHKLIGHLESVTALDIFTPMAAHGGGDPLVITCSIDKLVIVWNLITGERLQTLVGHTDRVCFLKVFMPPSYLESRDIFPSIISGGDDKMNIIWEDSLYQMKMMPTRDNVNRAFAFDLKEDDWPMLTLLAQESKGQIFVENSHLFFLALRHERPDFLLKFRTFLSKTIVFMNKYDETGTAEGVGEKMNILRYAIHKSDLVSVRAILLSWTENLNTDIYDLLTQRIYHACYFFDEYDLQLLAKEYPQELINFISALRLVRNHPRLMTDGLPMVDSDTSPWHQSWLKFVHRVRVAFGFKPNVAANVPDMKKHDASSANMLGRIVSFDGKEDELLPAPHSSLPSAAGSSNMLEMTAKDTDAHRKQRLNQYNRLEVKGVRSRKSDFKHVWEQRFDQNNWRNTLTSIMERIFLDKISEKQPITSLLVPLSGGGLDIKRRLITFVQVSDQLEDVSIFNSDVGIMSLQFSWEQYGRFGHLSATIIYLTFLAMFDLCIYTFQFYYYQAQVKHHVSRTGYYAMFAFNWIVLLGYLWYFLEELMQVHIKYGRWYDPRNFLLHIIRDFWNGIDLCIIGFGVTGLIMRIYHAQDTATGRCFLAVASIAMWCKVLYFLRPFAYSGPIVAMILTILYEIRYILLVLFVILAGFTQAFWLISNLDQTNDFGTVRSAFYSAFLYMLGQNVVTSFDNTVSDWFGSLLLVFFLFTMMILMLNLLIALMGDAFSKVREQGFALWRKEQASIVLDQHFLLTLLHDWYSHQPYLQRWFGLVPTRRNNTVTAAKYLHVLKYTSDVATGKATEGMLKLAELVEESKYQVETFAPFVLDDQQEKAGE